MKSYNFIFPTIRYTSDISNSDPANTDSIAIKNPDYFVSNNPDYFKSPHLHT